MTTPRLTTAALLLAASVARPALAADTVRIEDAIRSAWKENPALRAGSHMVAAARSDAAAARDGHWPTLAVTAKGVGTNEPVGVFGMKLDEQRISETDFIPSSLNYPGAFGAVGLGASVMVPIWMGGRIVAGQNAAAAVADAEEKTQARRRDEMALAVVQAYFGVQVATQGLRYADDVLEHARETERFVRERNQQGLAFDADVARAVAFRAQAEAEKAAVAQQLASARSALAMLTGLDLKGADLGTPVEVAAPAPLPAPVAGAELSDKLAARPDVMAARLRAQAADEGVGISRASILPSIFATGGIDTLTSGKDKTGWWWSAALVARWEIGLSAIDGVQSAEARRAAAVDAARWQEVQATREVDEARRAVATADARVRSAREAVAASESARSLREARYRQGLLPITDLLEAEAALNGARTLLLKSLLETRIARAQLDLALGLHVEGVQS